MGPVHPKSEHDPLVATFSVLNSPMLQLHSTVLESPLHLVIVLHKFFMSSQLDGLSWLKVSVYSVPPLGACREGIHSSVAENLKLSKYGLAHSEVPKNESL